MMTTTTSTKNGLSRQLSKEVLEIGDVVVVQTKNDDDAEPRLEGIIVYLEYPVATDNDDDALNTNPQQQQHDMKVGIRLTGKSSRLGNHNGTVNGIKYFDCPMNSGIIIEKSQIAQIRSFESLTDIEKDRLKRELGQGRNEEFDVSARSTRSGSTGTYDLQSEGLQQTASPLFNISNNSSLAPSERQQQHPQEVIKAMSTSTTTEDQSSFHSIDKKILPPTSKLDNERTVEADQVDEVFTAGYNNNNDDTTTNEGLSNGNEDTHDQAKSHGSSTTTTATTKKRQQSWSAMARQHYHLIREDPQSLLLALFLFVVLVASGIAMAVIFQSSSTSNQQQEVLALAKETGLFFSQNLNDAILPLFSLAQFVNEVDIFQNLASEIGLAGEPGALPFLPPKVDGGDLTHRNISGVCDDPTLVQKFEKIAGDIKSNAGMDGILVNLQLVPDAVVCLLHPLNNTEDFPPGVYMDNSGALGHDLLEDPARKFIAEATLPSEKVVIAGPLTLRQCQDCDPTVEKAFIARLPISSETNTIVVNGIPHQKWGFAVALINWNELILRSGVYDVFDGEDMEFQLTRTDQKYDAEDDTYSENVVVLAESPQFSKSIGEKVSTVLPTTNNDWEMTIMYCTSGCNAWFPWVIVAVVLLSFCLSSLVYTIFSQKQLHANQLAEKQIQMVTNSRKAAQSERELNDFIAHEVRNPLAAAMSAVSFVSTSVNENEPLLTQESRDSVRADVRIIENALQFVNDLLRSMLDLHRARSNQLTLEEVLTDIKRDVLDSVASMLYHRDSMFVVEVDCPENLIVSVDRLRLKQVVLNLARNSLKFVEKGFVRLRAEPILGNGDVADRNKDTGIMIYVEDSGPGIPLEKREKLFARFQDSLDELSQGTGIGLSLCKKLVDLMGGSIVLDESYYSGIPGKPGTKLDIHIKCEIVEGTSDFEDQSSATNTNSSPEIEINPAQDLERGCGEDVPSSSLGGAVAITEELPVLPEEMNVLFVDDDMVLRKMFCRSLKRIRPKWNIQEASSGEAAIKIVAERQAMKSNEESVVDTSATAAAQPFDIIFTDQYMTSVDKQLLGTETVRKLRAIGVTCFICGLSANDMEAPFIDAGADSFMIKPFPCKPEPLTKELLRVLNKKQFVY